ncbi:MAG: hypothetical protein NE330_04150, partial [Lentisphaeraceae bacterium]|nr:hypothetical protein [Lentisphaeraceae bacterium]
MKIIIVLLALLLASCSTSNKIVPASSLPATTPWDLELLSTTPEYKWSTGDKVRSLYYKNLEYKGKTSRVFAYYATPGTLKGDTSQDKNLPGIVLVHGGGGRAFEAWVKLWASRGYAAIAMDLGGCGPEKNKRIQDGGPAQGHPDKFQTIDKPINEH